MASRLARANAVTVNDVLDGHTLLEIDCADRVYLTLSVPSLVVGGQVVNFITGHERNPIPSLPCWSGGGRRSAGRCIPSPRPTTSRC
jgi:hypothetical protein